MEEREYTPPSVSAAAGRMDSSQNVNGVTSLLDGEIVIDEATSLLGEAGEATDDATWTVDADDGKLGVTVPTYRAANGQFLPGNPGKPKRDTDLVKAFRAQYTPDIVVQRLEATYAVAEKRGSWRGMLETTRLAIEYTEGTPIRKLQVARGSPDDWLRALSQVQLPESPEDTE